MSGVFTSAGVGVAALALVALGGVPGGAAAVQDRLVDVARIDPDTMPRPSLEARRASAPLVLDGVLNDAVWAEADSSDGVFYQSVPEQGLPSSERTVVRVLYDDDRLYVGAVMHDRRPEALVAAGLEQDFATQDSDIFGVALDTYWDRRNAFLFAVNPAGALFDAQAFNDQQSVNRAWEGEVEVATSVGAHGWTAEIAIPFRTLRFRESSGTQTWGVNFSRRIRRISEDSNWAPLSRQFRIYKMSRAGMLTSLRGLRQGRNVWFKPFVNGVLTDGTATGEPRRKLEGGLDLKWGVTPRLTLDATAFTDFSQAEADEEQINLTRFSLFFPEKRDFFLENAGIFDFQDARVRNFRTGSGPQNFKLFHSRRIGLSAERTPLPIAGGARLTGRLGRYAVGLLNMQTRSDPGHSAENFSVVRLRRNILDSSDAGIMFVNRQGTGGDATGRYNRSFGADANLRLAGGRMLVNSYVAATAEADGDGDIGGSDDGRAGNARATWGERTAGAFEVAWRDPLWNASVLLKSVGDAFNPGTGFVSRRGVRQGFATVGAHPQPSAPHLRELNPYVDVNLFADASWRLESREVKPGLGVAFLDSGLLTVEYSARFERLRSATPVAGVAVASGEYGFSAVSASYRSNLGRKLGGTVSWVRGGFFDGSRASISGSVAFRPSARFFVEGTAQRNRLTLASSTFDANLFSGRFRYGHDTRKFLSAFVQYNQATEEVLANVRLNVVHAPLSDVFVVYSERRDRSASAGLGALRDRRFALKVTKLLAL